MSNYTITTDFGAKDSLPSSNDSKVVRGSEFTTEFTNIQTAIATKADTAGDTFTGVVNFSADVAVNTNTLFVDVSEAKVGIGTTSPDTSLHVDGGDVKISSDSATSNGDGKPTIFFSESGADEVYAQISYHGDDESGTSNFIGIGCSGAVGTTEALMKENHQMVVKASGNVGIGTDNPAKKLHVLGGDVRIESTFPRLYLTDTNNNSDYSIINNNGQFGIYDDTNATYRMVIANTSGNVGIGTDSPATSLHVLNASDTQIRLSQTGEGSYDLGVIDGDKFAINRDGLTNEFVMSAGNVGIGTSSPKQQLHISGGTSSGDVTKVAIGATGTNAETHLQLAERFTGNDMSYGFSFIADGNNTNNLLIKNHDNSTTGNVAMSVGRGTGRVGIGTDTPDAKLHVQNGDIKITSDSSSGADGIASLLFAEFDDDDASYNANVAHAIVVYNGSSKLGDANYLGFGVFNQSNASEDTLAEQKLLTDLNITRDGKVGIGTSSPSAQLHIKNDDAGFEVDVDNQVTDGVRLLAYDRNTSVERPMQYRASQHIFRDGTEERMRIDTTGKVGIGTTSPERIVHAEGTPTVFGDSRSVLQLADDTAMAAGVGGGLILTGKAITGQANANTVFGAIQAQKENGTSGNTDSYMTFCTRQNGNNPAERMRINSSGNLLIGTTNASVYDSTSGGNTGFVYTPNGFLQIARQTTTTTQSVMNLNKMGADGNIIELYKDGSNIGNIGNSSTRLFAGSGATGLMYDGSNNYIVPWNTSTNAGRDNAIDLGVSSFRFKDIYRSGSTYSTSDRSKKQDIRDLTDAEARVATVAKGSLKAFRYIDSVEAEGDEANIHFGIIAQDLKAAFEAEGLNANDYQVFKTSTYTDDDGVEQTTYSICYENLLAFIIAAI